MQRLPMYSQLIHFQTIIVANIYKIAWDLNLKQAKHIHTTFSDVLPLDWRRVHLCHPQYLILRRKTKKTNKIFSKLCTWDILH